MDLIARKTKYFLFKIEYLYLELFYLEKEKYKFYFYNYLIDNILIIILNDKNKINFENFNNILKLKIKDLEE
ncbi:MAG: hypothetical protein OHK0038_18120 [Flammeovirgaceae bacterium]